MLQNLTKGVAKEAWRDPAQDWLAGDPYRLPCELASDPIVSSAPCSASCTGRGVQCLELMRSDCTSLCLQGQAQQVLTGLENKMLQGCSDAHHCAGGIMHAGRSHRR